MSRCNFRGRLRQSRAALALMLPAALLAGCGGGSGEAGVARSAPQSAPVHREMVYEHNVPIAVRDGTVLLANVFRPQGAGRFPVIMSSAPYGKDKGFPHHREMGVVDPGGDTTYLPFEQPNPGFWVPRGYALVQYDTRGFSGSQGYATMLDDQEARDYYDAIEWAAAQPWSNGSVGLSGVSYYAANQYRVATLKPPHLKAIMPWQGLADPYRDIAYQGGILNQFVLLWGASVSKQATDKTRAEPFIAEALAHPLDDELWKTHAADLSKIDVPMLAVGRLSDQSLHLRGTTEAFMASASPHKKMLLLAGTLFGPYYGEHGTTEQLRFFDYWLKGLPTGIDQERPVKIEVRTDEEHFYTRSASSWPIEGTAWTPLYLTPGDDPAINQGGLSLEAPQQSGSVLTASGPQPQAARLHPDGALFTSAPLDQDLEVTGPVMAKLWVSASAGDFDVIAELRDIDQQGNELRFPMMVSGERDEPAARGWLRVSHRKLDPVKSTFYRPYHTHDELQPLLPGEVAPIEVEFWPTSLVFKRGHRVQLSIRHNDYLQPGRRGLSLLEHAYGIDVQGLGLPPFLDLSFFQSIGPPASVNTLHTGGERASYLLLPVQPGAN